MVHSPRLANFCTYLSALQHGFVHVFGQTPRFLPMEKRWCKSYSTVFCKIGVFLPFHRNIPIRLPTKMGAMPTKVDKSIEIASIVASFDHRSRANAWRRVWRDPSIFRGETIPNFTKRWYKPSKDGWIIIALLTLRPKQLPVLSSYSPILQHDLEVATNYSRGL